MALKIPLMVDSGAYSASRQKGQVDINEYIAWCKDRLAQHPDVDIINLDEVANDPTGEISYRNWRIIREAGVPVIPVYHTDTPEKWLIRYLKDTKHIALSGLTWSTFEKNVESLDRCWINHLTDSDRKPIAKVHGLAFTSIVLMRRYPWYSVDSTSALQTAMYGNLWVPRKTNGKWNFNDNPLLYSVSSRGRKERGQHIDALPPEEKELIHEYLKHMGFAFGKSDWKDEDGKKKEVILEPGVSNRHELRSLLNIQYMSKFMQKLPWPRPLADEVRKGLFQ